MTKEIFEYDYIKLHVTKGNDQWFIDVVNEKLKEGWSFHNSTTIVSAGSVGCIISQTFKRKIKVKK